MWAIRSISNLNVDRRIALECVDFPTFSPSLPTSRTFPPGHVHSPPLCMVDFSLSLSSFSSSSYSSSSFSLSLLRPRLLFLLTRLPPSHRPAIARRPTRRLLTDEPPPPRLHPNRAVPLPVASRPLVAGLPKPLLVLPSARTSRHSRAPTSSHVPPPHAARRAAVHSVAFPPGQPPFSPSFLPHDYQLATAFAAARCCLVTSRPILPRLVASDCRWSRCFYHSTSLSLLRPLAITTPDRLVAATLADSPLPPSFPLSRRSHCCSDEISLCRSIPYSALPFLCSLFLCPCSDHPYCELPRVAARKPELLLSRRRGCFRSVQIAARRPSSLRRGYFYFSP